MKSSPPARVPSLPWELIASFAAVMRHGSLSAAGRALGLAQPTLRRHIEVLEARLGVVLFTRSTAGLLPTDAARQALTYADGMDALAAALVRSTSAAAASTTGIVRLSCSEIMAAEVLPGLLQPLLADHLGLVVELAASDDTADLLHRDADIAVRMLRPTQAGLVARRAGTIDVGLFASAAYVERRQMPATLQDLGAHLLVGDDRRQAVRPALAAFGLDPGSLHFVFRSDSDSAALAAVRAGIGIGICQLPLAARDPRLRRVLPNVSVPLDCWIVMHEDLRGQPRTRTVFDWLAQAVTKYASGTNA